MAVVFLTFACSALPSAMTAEVKITAKKRVENCMMNIKILLI
jgi:hypothetical protein